MNTEPRIKHWMTEQVVLAATSRAWKALPASFEADKVRSVFQKIKPHFGKADIKMRIAASKAVTFEELHEALAG
jgi:hypothetical protein